MSDSGSNASDTNVTSSGTNSQVGFAYHFDNLVIID
jgi:hypothetical protein